MINAKYSKNGVFCDPYYVEKGESIQLTYEGVLAEQGAQMIYARIGYGPNDGWTNTGEYEMIRSRDGKFEIDIPITEVGNLNVAFKDDGDNWDNNNGQNYIFPSKVTE